MQIVTLQHLPLLHVIWKQLFSSLPSLNCSTAVRPITRICEQFLFNWSARQWLHKVLETVACLICQCNSFQIKKQLSNMWQYQFQLWSCLEGGLVFFSVGVWVECKGLGSKLLNWSNALIPHHLHPCPQAKSDYWNSFPQLSVCMLFFL